MKATKKATKTNNKVSKATQKARAKKKRQTPLSLKLRKASKENWNKKNLSLNALIKFAKGDEGLSFLTSEIFEVNDRLGTKIRPSDITVKSVLENLSDRERFISKDGKITSEKRTKFTLHYVQLAVGRIAKASLVAKVKKAA